MSTVVATRRRGMSIAITRPTQPLTPLAALEAVERHRIDALRSKLFVLATGKPVWQ